MDGRRKRKANHIFVLFAACLMLSACGGTGEKNPAGESVEASRETEVQAASYDSADTCIYVSSDREAGTMTFLNLDVNKKYTLSMDGTTCFYDKYGGALSFDQLVPGAVVDVTFQKGKKHLTSLQESPKAWCYEKVERYSIDREKETLNIGDEIYKLGKAVLFYNDGRVIEGEEIGKGDILSFRGIDKNVLTVTVEKGHGYLRLSNASNFIGGWIEVGQVLISRISDKMLLSLPEGSYEVNISHEGSEGVKRIVINRNRETVLDIGDIKLVEPKVGSVKFVILPEEAELLVDGETMDHVNEVRLTYGLHQVLVRAKGYQSISRYLKVGQASAKIEIELEADPEEEEEETSEEESKKDRVIVEEPEDAEVYLDGNYIGISPCSFDKESGSHIITLRKSGYITKSYTIRLDDTKKDISYSFAELERESYTVSGNDAGS